MSSECLLNSYSKQNKTHLSLPLLGQWRLFIIKRFQLPDFLQWNLKKMQLLDTITDKNFISQSVNHKNSNYTQLHRGRKMQKEAESSAKTAISSALQWGERKASIFSLGANLGQGRHDLGTWKVNHLFPVKATQKITERSWSSHTS